MELPSIVSTLAPAKPVTPVSAPDAHTGSSLDEQRAASLALLDALQAKYQSKAENGDVAAAGLILAILKHRAALLGLAHAPAPALRVAASSTPASAEPCDLKLVVEYVNDWRDVLRRRG